MIPIVSIVGKSKSGKTTLIEKIIPELVKKGWRVATIKHSTHNFEVDQEGKDSWRHRKAGARTTVVSSDRKLAVVADAPKDYSIAELSELYIRDVDIIITEGFKKNPHPKIEIYRRELKRGLISSKEDNLIALAGDHFLEAGVPFFDLNDATGIAGFI
ncbi:MAG: molybdopterin-guanine dinucleotide biosynthesis protein B, partial [Smithellaceae bacterium]|nr:molybdopterin-guanine dinucleotide biosynthesis protein B [Smithellaceae bacterium]